MFEISLVRTGDNIKGLLASDRRYLADVEEGIPFNVRFSSSSLPARLDGIILSFYNEISKQLGDTDPKDVELQCRLELGVKLMRSEEERFDKWWVDLYEGRYTYEELLRVVAGIKIIELMTAKQKIAYLQMMRDQYADVEVSLVLPEWVPKI